MRQIAPHSLWLGHAGDVRNPRRLFDTSIEAVIDLATEEPPAQLPRELAYLRFPLLDGAGNPAWLLSSAVEAVARLLRLRVSALVACSAGLSRSPAVTSAAISSVTGEPPDRVIAALGRDVSGGLWRDVLRLASS